MTLGRVAGSALLALGVACWRARHDGPGGAGGAGRGVVMAMTLYNIGAMAVLGFAGVQLHPAGPLLWPAVTLHAMMAFWCIAALSERKF